MGDYIELMNIMANLNADEKRQQAIEVYLRWLQEKYKVNEKGVEDYDIFNLVLAVALNDFEDQSGREDRAFRTILIERGLVTLGKAGLGELVLSELAKAAVEIRQSGIVKRK